VLADECCDLLRLIEPWQMSPSGEDESGVDGGREPPRGILVAERIAIAPYR